MLDRPASQLLTAVETAEAVLIIISGDPIQMLHVQ